MANLFQPLHAPFRRPQEIVGQIEGAIYRGLLAPGDRLPAEYELARQFASSRSSVREALRTLEALGLISIRQGAAGGCFINHPDHRVVGDSLARAIRLGIVSLDDHTEVRVALEPYVARLAAERATAEDLERMAGALDLARRDLAARRAAKFSHLDFHLLVADAAHNPAISIIMHSFKHSLIASFADVPVDEESMTAAIRYHERIYDALAQHDGDRARAIMAEHILDVREWGRRSATEPADKDEGVAPGAPPRRAGAGPQRGARKLSGSGRRATERKLPPAGSGAQAQRGAAAPAGRGRRSGQRLAGKEGDR
ncbi:MAG: FadR family transcriptional regulator [Candidatus Tectomicrobia bacterium]|nr:FadR family transcriptional regulator [Candidatus Tectomicrobia bacterium]